MNSNTLPFVGAVLLVLGNQLAWFLTVLQLPGNWLIVLLTILAAWLMPEETRFRISWLTVGIVFSLAVFAEVLELRAGVVVAKNMEPVVEPFGWRCWECSARWWLAL